MSNQRTCSKFQTNFFLRKIGFTPIIEFEKSYFIEKNQASLLLEQVSSKTIMEFNNSHFRTP